MYSTTYFYHVDESRRLSWREKLCLTLHAVNVALLKPATQSSTYWTNAAAFAVDGNLTTNSCTMDETPEPWLSVDLGTPMNVGRVCATNADNQYYGSLHVCRTKYSKDYKGY